MIRTQVSLAFVALVIAACEAPALEEAAGSSEQPLAACSFTVTKNVYDGPNWWGTIAVKNASAAAASGFAIAFDVPAGVKCDYAPTGWSYAQSGATCTFKKSSGTIAAGATVTLNYSTDSQSFAAATNVKPTATGCGSAAAPAPAPTAAPAPTSSSMTWRKANLTNFTSYPDPGSEECVQYNGCTWAGQFAALPNKQPESWVKANNIIAVHSKDFANYKLKTLRLRQGTKQIDAKVYDECADSDCSGCCTANSKQTGFLIDVESYTAERFGTGDGIVEWTCLDCQ